MFFNDFIYGISISSNIDPTVLRVLIAIAFIVLGFVSMRFFASVIIKLFLKLVRNTKGNLDDMLVNAMERPAKVLIIGISIWAALSVLILPVIVQNFLYRSLRTFIIVIIFWFLFRSTDCFVYVFEHFINKTDKISSPVLIRVFRKSIKIIIVLLEIFMIIKEWGYDVSGLVAGLGIGGLAFSLAAKDAASNLLGSITIMSDRTYNIGDWIQANGIEGIVEDIGFRSTKIRTFSDSLISVPNSIMSNEPVTNWSKMGKRRVSFNLQIPLDTSSEKIELLLSKIREMLKYHDDINKDFMVVNINGFGEASLQIIIYYFTKTTSWASYLNVSQDVNLKILKIFEEIGVPIIPPHRMVVENPQIN
ncbi:MAG: mechanosensitive ion channel family protein [Acetivibrionales bacterium]